MLLIFALFLVVPYVYSQHIANAMPVDIPLNSTKESAIQKLLNYHYQLNNSIDQTEDGYQILYYEQKYNGKMVGLWLKNGRVSIVEWVLGGSVHEDDILMELKAVYGITPYAETVVSLGDPKNSLANEYECYFHWKGISLVTNSSLLYSALYILSNADAEKRLQKSNQKKIEQQQRLEKQKRQGQEQQGQRSLKELNEKLEMFRQQAEAKRKREADSIAHIQDSIAHIQELKENYSSCRFLFASEERFISCITQVNQNAIENEIKTLIGQIMAEISNVIVKGTEFKDQYRAKSEMDRICNIPNHMRNVSPAIANFTENKIIKFVADRKKLNNAYNRAKRKNPNVKCSEFLLTYIN